MRIRIVIDPAKCFNIVPFAVIRLYAERTASARSQRQAVRYLCPCAKSERIASLAVNENALDQAGLRGNGTGMAINAVIECACTLVVICVSSHRACGDDLPGFCPKGKVRIFHIVISSGFSRFFELICVGIDRAGGIIHADVAAQLCCVYGNRQCRLQPHPFPFCIFHLGTGGFLEPGAAVPCLQRNPRAVSR